MKIMIYAFLSISSLLVCLIMPFLNLSAEIGEGHFKSIFLAASVAWFAFSILWNREKKKQPKQRSA